MDRRRTRVASWLAVGALMVSGARARAEDATFYAEMESVNAKMHRGMAIAPGADVDRDFLRMMIPHHQGAIDMAMVLLKYGRDDRVRRLAQSIIVEQNQEITYMRTLLESAPGTPPTTRPVDR